MRVYTKIISSCRRCPNMEAGGTFGSRSCHITGRGITTFVKKDQNVFPAFCPLRESLENPDDKTYIEVKPKTK